VLDLGLEDLDVDSTVNLLGQGGYPIGVINDNGICDLKIQSKATCSRGKNEDE